MQIQQLEYFLEIAKEKNISKAARALYLSQPSLSQQVIKLEEELGIPLLVRHSKSISLTDAGTQFEQHAKRIVGGIHQLEDLMRKHSIMQAGTLHIGLLWIAGYIGLLRIMSDYRMLYPNIQFSLQIDGSSALLEQLLDRSIHAAFIIGEEAQLSAHKKELYYQKIQDDNYMVIVSRSNPLSRLESISVEDLRHQPLIMPSKSSAFYRQIKALFQQRYIEPNILCKTSLTDIVAQLATYDFAVGFASYSVAQTLQSPELAIVPLQEPLYRTIYYVTLHELLNYPTVKTLSLIHI